MSDAIAVGSVGHRRMFIGCVHHCCARSGGAPSSRHSTALFRPRSPFRRALAAQGSLGQSWQPSSATSWPQHRRRPREDCRSFQRHRHRRLHQGRRIRRSLRCRSLSSSKSSRLSSRRRRQQPVRLSRRRPRSTSSTSQSKRSSLSLSLALQLSPTTPSSQRPRRIGHRKRHRRRPRGITASK